MSAIVYVALVARPPEGGYRARFPDLPGCEAEGETLAALIAAARQRLLAALEACESRGEAWPDASPLEAFAPEPGVTPVPVDVQVEDPPIRVNVSLGERLVQRLDAAAEARGMTRSGFIAQAVRARLGEGGPQDFEAVSRRLQDELAAMARRVNETVGPDSPFTRRMNELDAQLYDGVRRAADSLAAAMSRRRDAARGGAAAPQDPA